MNFSIRINAVALLALAMLMALDAVLFLETSAVFAESAAACAIVGVLVYAANGGFSHTMRPVHGFFLTSSVWLTASVAGATPLLLWGLTPVDALFEAVSGLTTTGSTVMTGLDETPKGILLWRATLQAIGGVGFIVTGVALLPILRVGGMQLFRTESSEKGEKELANAARFAAATLVAYAALMGLCAIVYDAGGMSSFDAITHSMTTLSTGGYSNYDASFGHFDSAFLQYAAAVFMLLGSFPFAWYIRAALRRRFDSEQIKTLVAFVLVASVLLTFWLVLATGKSFEPAFREVVFNVISIVTTTGFATVDYTKWGSFAVAAFFILTFVGGCTGSTSGGAKIMRWIVFARVTQREIRRIHSPNVVIAARYEGVRLGDDVVTGVMTFFSLYIGTMAVLAFLLNAVGLDFDTAISGALTAVANVGPGIGPLIGPSGNFQSLSDSAKLLLSAGMFLGRLEFMTVFVVLMPSLWQEM